jgi:pimeloyl-ACP methyl ester carboxylesterase
MTLRSRRVELSTGLSYHLLEWNPDAPATLLLVHGFLDSAWGFHPLVEAGLSDRFHVIAPDMRGHGDSDWIGSGGYYHFFDYVADLRALIDQLVDKPLFLVGHSMGGTICGYFAGAFPDSVEKLALLEGMGPPANATPVPERVQHWYSTWTKARHRSPRTYTSVEEAAKRLMKRDAALPEEQALFFAERGTRESAEGLVFKHDPTHLSLGPYPFQVEIAEQFWKRISCPVLLVEGENSSMIHAEAEAERREGCLKDRRKVVLPKAGHMMQRHQPQTLASQLLSFFGGS